MDDFKFNFPPLWDLTSAIGRSKADRALDEIDLYKLYALAKKEFDKKIQEIILFKMVAKK